MGTSAWLISRAAQHPSEASLTLAIVGVQFFGLSRGFLRYGERLVGHDAALRVLAEPPRARVRAARSGGSRRSPGLPAWRPRGPLRRRRGLAAGRRTPGAPALLRGSARRGGDGCCAVVVPPTGRPRPPRRPGPLGDGRALADRAPGPARGVTPGHRARRALGRRGRSRGGCARTAGDGSGRRAAGPDRRVGRPVAPRRAARRRHHRDRPRPHDRPGRVGQLGRPDARGRRHPRRLAQRRAPRRPGTRPAGCVRAGLAVARRDPGPPALTRRGGPGVRGHGRRRRWSTTRRTRWRCATGRTRSPCAGSGPPTPVPDAPRCGAWTWSCAPDDGWPWSARAGRASRHWPTSWCGSSRPTRERRSLDGVPLERLAADDVRRVVGLVEQSPHLFDTTLAENLRVGRRARHATPNSRASWPGSVWARGWRDSPTGSATAVGPRGTPVGRAAPAGRRRPRPAGRLPHPGARRAGASTSIPPPPTR